VSPRPKPVSGPAAPVARRTQAERRATAEEGLLDAAAKLFALRGVEQTSLAQVGEEAGYSRGLVNQRFGSKAVLVERLVQRSQRDFVSGLADSSDGTEVDALVAIAGSYLRAIGSDAMGARAYFVLWGAALPREADIRAVVGGGDEQFRLGVESVIRLGQQKKTISGGVNPAGTAVAIVGMLRGIAALYLIDPADVDLAAASAACEQFVRDSLTPRTQSRRRR